MWSSVVPKFGRTEPVHPLRGARVDEIAKERLQTLVDTLRLSVCLWVIAGAQAKRNFDELEQLLPEHACEDLVTVGDDGIRKTMKLVDVVKE